MRGAPIVFYAIAGLLIVAHLLLPASAWFGWIELALMCGAGLWPFQRSAGIWTMWRRSRSLGVNVTLGLMLLGFNLMPDRHLAFIAVGSLAILLLQRAMPEPTPMALPPVA